MLEARVGQVLGLRGMWSAPMSRAPNLHHAGLSLGVPVLRPQWATERRGGLGVMGRGESRARAGDKRVTETEEQETRGLGSGGKLGVGA